MKASAEMLIDVDEPAVRDKVGCGAARAKSDCPVEVIVVCEIEPDVPVTVRLTGAASTFEAAVMITLCEGDDDAVGVSMNVAGDADTPAGRPESVKLTGFEKPFVPVIEMEINWVEFGATVTDGGIDIEKSGWGVDVAPDPDPPEAPPPQQMTESAGTSKRNNRSVLNIRINLDSAKTLKFGEISTRGCVATSIAIL